MAPDSTVYAVVAMVLGGPAAIFLGTWLITCVHMRWIGKRVLFVGFAAFLGGFLMALEALAA